MKIPLGAIQLEGTPYVMLANDTELPLRAGRMGTIVIETVIAEIPEVMALRPGQVVADVGAFIGDTALIFLAKGCKVIAFEPFADAFRCLEYNTQDMFIESYQHAIGNGGGYSLVWETPTQNDGNRHITMHESGTPTIKLDDLTWSRLDLLKIDVEGAELLVLEGSALTIARFRPIIVAEANDQMLAKFGKTKADLKAALEALGYKVRVGTYTEEREVFDYVATPA
jgi:FkbM family methyltransferase